jgi:hypothetical protein
MNVTQTYKYCFCNLPHDQGSCSCACCSSLIEGQCYEPPSHFAELFDTLAINFNVEHDLSDYFDFNGGDGVSELIDALLFFRGGRFSNYAGTNAYYVLERIFVEVAASAEKTLTLTPECRMRSCLYNRFPSLDLFYSRNNYPMEDIGDYLSCQLAIYPAYQHIVECFKQYATSEPPTQLFQISDSYSKIKHFSEPVQDFELDIPGFQVRRRIGINYYPDNDNFDPNVTHVHFDDDTQSQSSDFSNFDNSGFYPEPSAPFQTPPHMYLDDDTQSQSSVISNSDHSFNLIPNQDTEFSLLDQTIERFKYQIGNISIKGDDTTISPLEDMDTQ